MGFFSPLRLLGSALSSHILKKELNGIIYASRLFYERLVNDTQQAGVWCQWARTACASLMTVGSSISLSHYHPANHFLNYD